MSLAVGSPAEIALSRHINTIQTKRNIAAMIGLAGVVAALAITIFLKVPQTFYNGYWIGFASCGGLWIFERGRAHCVTYRNMLKQISSLKEKFFDDLFPTHSVKELTQYFPTEWLRVKFEETYPLLKNLVNNPPRLGEETTRESLRTFGVHSLAPLERAKIACD